MISKTSTILGILVVLVLAASTVCAVEKSQVAEPSSPLQTPALSASRKLLQERSTLGEWKDAGVGEPALAGNHTRDQKTLRITGAGAGLNLNGSDQFQFVHLTREAGDFEVAARLVNFAGEGDATAGIMARIDNSPNSAMTTLFFKIKRHCRRRQIHLRCLRRSNCQAEPCHARLRPSSLASLGQPVGQEVEQLRCQRHGLQRA
jgi:hypothetical protein